MNFSVFLDYVFLGNRVYDYLIALIILVIGIICIRLLKRIVMRNLKSWTTKTQSLFDDYLLENVEKRIFPLVYFGILYLSLRSLVIHRLLAKSLNILGIVLLTYMSIRFIISMIEYSLENYGKDRADIEIRRSQLKGLLPAVKIVIYGIGIVFLLDNLGFKITTIVAGLGIGGIAVALASQTILGDLFGYVCILFDRPFEVGDFLIIGDFLGSVEHIGIKTTRIRSLGGEQLIFSNTDLTNARIKNYKRMNRRRVVFKLGVIYQTPVEKLKKIPVIIKDIIDNIEMTTFDRAHFSAYGDFNLILEVVYYVELSDYNKYMDIQQQINLEIYSQFKEEGIEFAYPTQTLFLEKINSQSSLE